MSRATTLRHEFVNAIPAELDNGVLYVSLEYATALHLCCCGCGTEVITPLSPIDWRITYDGETVSIFPSIGNWSFSCRSHYWIDRGRVRWSSHWSKRQIERGREEDRHAKRAHYDERSGEGKTAMPGETPRTIKGVLLAVHRKLRRRSSTVNRRSRY